MFIACEISKSLYPTTPSANSRAALNVERAVRQVDRDRALLTASEAEPYRTVRA